MTEKYLAGPKRETAYWAAAMAVLFESKIKNYKGDAQKWLRSVVISLEAFLRTQLRGISKKDLDTFSRLVKRVEPQLRLTKFYSKDDDIIQVSTEDMLDFAEYALEYCVDKCEGKYTKCRLREVMQRVGIPAFVEGGPCPYYRGE